MPPAVSLEIKNEELANPNKIRGLQVFLFAFKYNPKNENIRTNICLTKQICCDTV